MQALTGIHLIGDLENCDLSLLPGSSAEINILRRSMSALLVDHHLKELGSHYHLFGPKALTATVCLAESHLCFHTWPEYRRVSLDIYVCNLAEDCSQNAERVFDFMTKELFRAGAVERQVVRRGR